MKKIAARILMIIIFPLYLASILIDCTVGIAVFIFTGKMFIITDAIHDMENWITDNI